jgi:cellulose synthase operon protein C
VLGTCESCRAQDSHAPAARVEVLEDLPPAPEAAGGARLGRLKPAPEEARAAKTDGRSPTAPMVGMPGVTVVAGGGDSGRTWKLVAVAAAVVVLAGGGGAAWFFLRGASGEESGQKAPAERPLPPSVQAAVERWQRLYPNLQGEAAPLLTEGRSLLGQETHEAYLKAVETFQRALVLNPRSGTAMAGYVQALALAHGNRLEESAYQEALELVEASKSRKEIQLGLLLAHANLLLTRPLGAGHSEQVKQLAEQVVAQGSPPEQAEANLVLGRLYLHSSSELASEHLEKALALEQKLARVYHYRALALESGGDYAGALASLRKRLEVDERNPDSLEALARILAELGEVPQARKVYEERTQGKEVRLEFQLPLAALRYQAEGGKASEVLSLLRGLSRGRERYAPGEAAEVLLHLATAERLGGNAQAAAKAAREALELRKDMPEAALQLFLVHLAQKDEAEAARQLEALRGRLESPALEKVLEGRLRLLEGKPEQALELFQEAVKLDDRRVDAQLLAGVAAAQAGRRDEAFRLLYQATQADPLRVAPRGPVLSRFYMRPGETLQGVEGALVRLSKSREDVVPLLYEGVLNYHQGDLAVAEKLLRKVNEEDLNNAPSLAYRALVALQRRDMNQARSLSEKAVAAGRRMALPWLVRGLVLAEEAKQGEQAQKALREALTLAPALLSAEVKLAELEARAKNMESARSRLRKVLGLDPSYQPAKRALYQLNK